jgi:hypothetical protein
MMRAMSAGCGGISAVNALTKALRVIDSIGLKRFSNPRVDAGLPDSPAPQALPAWWPG